MGLLRTLLTIGIVQALLGNGDELLSGAARVMAVLGLFIGSIIIWLVFGFLWAIAFQISFGLTVHLIRSNTQ